MRRRPGRPLVIAAAAVTFLLTSGCGDATEDTDLGPVLAVTAAVPQGSAPLEPALLPAPAPATAAAPAAPAVDPCTVLTAADVEQVLGEPVDLVNDLYGCDYMTRGTPATMVGVSVSDFTGTVGEFQRQVEANASATPGAGTWPVSGLGEAATAITFAEDVQLYVKVPNAYLVFSVVNPTRDPQASLAILQQTALAASANGDTTTRG